MKTLAIFVLLGFCLYLWSLMPDKRDYGQKPPPQAVEASEAPVVAKAPEKKKEKPKSETLKKNAPKPQPQAPVEPAPEIPSPMRTWTNAKGEETLGRITSYRGSTVEFYRASDRKVFKETPITSFSEPDRRYIGEAINRANAKLAELAGAEEWEMKVEQVIPGGFLIRKHFCISQIGSLQSSVNQIMGRDSTSGPSNGVELNALTNCSGLNYVDGDTFTAFIKPAGTYQFTDTTGALRTVRSYRLVRP